MDPTVTSFMLILKIIIFVTNNLQAFIILGNLRT